MTKRIDDRHRSGKFGRATIRDVAREAGVSIATVSCALNNGPRNVSPATRKRVLETAKKLDYQPSPVARSLVKKRVGAIGVVFNPHHDRISGNTYVGAMLDGMGNAARELGYSLLLYTGVMDYADDLTLRRLRAGHVDGLILLAPPGEWPLITRLANSRLCVVIAGSRCNHEAIPWVDADNEGGSKAAVEHLLALGHRRIAHITGGLWQVDSRLRLQAYRQALSEHGLAYDPDLVAPGDFQVEKGAQALKHFWQLSRPPTAVFCGSDNSALGVLHAAREIGLRIPDDLAVVGFDDSSWCATTDPPLSSIRQPIPDIGATAVHHLHALVEGDQEKKHTILATQLQVRRSSDGIPPRAPQRPVPSRPVARTRPLHPAERR